MNSREGRVVGIEDGFVIVCVDCDDAVHGRRQQRLAYVPQQVLPAAAVGQTVTIPLADWELDQRAFLVCLLPLAALAGAFVWPLFDGVAAFGATIGAAIGGWLTRFLALRPPACTIAAQPRTAAEPMAE